MKILRSSLLIAILSLLVLTGYGIDLFDHCDTPVDQKQTELVKSDLPSQLPSGGDEDCHCVCHQFITPIAALGWAVRLASSTEGHGLSNEFPPDAVPFGIDLPPQIA